MSVTNAPDPHGKPPERRRLVAVVYADMVGYSRLIGLDDVGTLARMRSLRSKVIDPAIEEHGGRIVQTGGDSLLVVFVVSMERCAVRFRCSSRFQHTTVTTSPIELSAFALGSTSAMQLPTELTYMETR